MARPKTAALLPVHQQPSLRRGGVAHRAGRPRALVGLAFGNSPSAMLAWGGTVVLFGTNPIAAVFPRRDGLPLSIHMSLSEVARGKLMVAADEGKAIPLGWALDKRGNPTTDPQAGLEGAMLALMVELLVNALTGVLCR
jgi:(2R)-3-sulfolactate dehydrogenase (NADP+)